jgi:hypothetical protein
MIANINQDILLSLTPPVVNRSLNPLTHLLYNHLIATINQDIVEVPNSQNNIWPDSSLVENPPAMNAVSR